MFVVLLFMLFGPHFHPVLTVPVRVIAYEGETVTLKSRASTIQNFTKIRWSIFANKTFIADFNRGDLSTDLFWSYSRRLTLNTTTGDLQIKNVTRSDDTLYSLLLMFNGGVQKSHDVQLTVRAQLPEPILSAKVGVISDSHCPVNLNCTSLQNGLSIKWAYVGDLLYSSNSDSNNNLHLRAFLSEKRSATFSCTISDDLRNKTKNLLVSCQNKKRNWYTSVFTFGFWGGMSLAAIAKTIQNRR